MTFIIVDFEATCCNKGSVARNEMEIIEIGAIALQEDNLETLGEYQTFIRPVRHEKLTVFCRELTSITQEEVDSSDTFPQALKHFTQWINQYDNPVFCSWGNYDKSQLKQDCDFHSAQYPFSNEHINIKKVFATNMGIKKPMGLGKALKYMKMQFEGTAHRGIDDARNMARLAPHIFK